MSVDLLLRPGTQAISVHPSNSLASSSTLVIGTNDSSILSKRSAERLGYFTQPQFLKHFINKPQRRTSLINIGYTIRTLIIDLIIKRFLLRLSQSSTTIIVNLGCGYDPGFFKLATNDQIDSFFHYIDVDYPELISKKYQLIAQSEELNQILPGFTNSKIGDSLRLPNNKASYTLLGCDLCDSKTFIQKLSHLIQDRRNDAHILFISEVSTVYMPAGKSDELIQNISLSFPNAIWSCLEQVLSSTPTAFSDTMLKHFHKLRTPIRGTLAYPTIADQLKRLESHWKVIEMSTMHDIWKAFDLNHSTFNEKERLMNLEEFDEWEELDLFLSHYVVTIAYSNPVLMDAPQLPIGIALPPLQHRSQPTSGVLSSPEPAEPGLPWCYTSVDSSIHRRGHTSTSLPDRQLLVFGGFGLPNAIKSSTNQKLKSSLTHARLSHPLILGFTRNLSIQTTHLPIDHSTPSARLHHSASLVIKDDHSPFVFFFGGRSSPRAPLADAYMFNCTTHTWTPVNPSGTDSLWPPPRFRHAALTIQIDNSTYVLIHGGIGLEGAILNDSWLFDPNRNCWTRLIAIEKFVGPRHSHQIYYDLRGRELFFFGGITTIYDQSEKTRLGNNIKLALTFGKDMALEVQSDLPELLDLKLDDALLHRYSHRVTAWDEKDNTLIMSGGISANGVITTEHQYVLLNLKSGVCRVLQLPRQKAQTMIGHTISVIDVCPLGEIQPRLKAALVVGGGATCFSFGSSFDTLAEIISDSDLSLIEDAHSSENNESEVNRKTCGTFDSSREDTWDQVQEVTRIEKMTSRSWMDVLSTSKPVVFDTRNEIGECIELWTPEYLKMKCGEKKCSIHLSHPHSSTTLKWHDKNFKYDTMSFSELVDRTIGANESLAAENRDQVVYLRSLSHSPKQASNFHCDFAEISNDFKIPQPVNDYIRDHDAFFSSVLRISGADMGLWAHYDTYDNILVQVKGEKLVRLWHPREIVNLYVEGSSSHIPSFDTPDLDRFPLYRKSHPMVCILKPGDTLFIPANWIHAVQTLEPSISINTFFKTEPLEKFYDVRKKDIWGNVDLAPYHDLHHHIFHQFSSLPKLAHPPPNQLAPLQSTLLDHLPLPQRQFYLKKIALDLIRYADQLS